MMQLPENLIKSGDDYATLNATPGQKVYGERLIKKGGLEYRVWDPWRSKLSAALKHGLKSFPFKKNSTVLYLGAGNGTTASHVADICTDGLVYCVEISPRAMTDLYAVCQGRKNMVPILASAITPQLYEDRISKVDIVYQDVAQKLQLDILNKNVDYFLNPKGFTFLMIKARSIDVAQEPKKVFTQISEAMYSKYSVHQQINLDPEEKDHQAIVAQVK